MARTAHDPGKALPDCALAVALGGDCPATTGRWPSSTTDRPGAVDPAAANTSTRPIPKTAQARTRFLLKTEKGSAAVAARLGITRRTVERYLKVTLRRPRKDLAARPRSNRPPSR